MGFVVDFVDSAVSAVVGAVDDVATAVTNTVKAAIKDPVKTIAQVAAVATGNAWALPLIEGADVAYAGGSIGDVAKAIVIADLTQGVARGVSEYVGSGLSDTLGQTGATIVAQGTANAAVAVIRGRDPLQAFVAGGVTAAVPALLGKVDAFTELPPTAQRAIQSTVSAALTGQDVSGALIGSLVQSSNITSKILKSFDPDGTMFSAGQSAVISKTLVSGISASLSGRDPSAAMQSALFNAGTQALKQFVKNDFKTSVDGVTNAWDQAQEQKQKLNSNAEQQATLASEYAKTANEFNAKTSTQQQLFNEQQRLRDEYNTLAGQGASTDVLNQKVEALDAATQKYNDYATSLSKEYERNYAPILNSKAQEIEQLKAERAVAEKTYNTAIESISKAAKPVEEISNQVAAKTKEFAVAELNPEFNSEAYAKLNDVTGDPYEHYLKSGYESKLPTNYESGADAALKSLGYKASPDEVKQVADLFKKSADPDVALGKFYDEHWVTQEEAAAAAKQAGFTLTPEQLKTFVGQTTGGQNTVLEDVARAAKIGQESQQQRTQFVDSQMAAVKQAYKDQGYSDEQINAALPNIRNSVGAAIDQMVGQAADYASQVKAVYGENSKEYAAAQKQLLETQAATGSAGVVKNGNAFETMSGETRSADTPTKADTWMQDKTKAPATVTGGDQLSITGGSNPNAPSGVFDASGKQYSIGEYRALPNNATIYDAQGKATKLSSMGLEIAGTQQSQLGTLLQLGQTAPEKLLPGPLTALFGGQTGGGAETGTGFSLIGKTGAGDSVYGKEGSDFSLITYADNDKTVAVNKKTGVVYLVPRTEVPPNLPKPTPTTPVIPPPPVAPTKDPVAEAVKAAQKAADEGRISQSEAEKILTQAGYKYTPEEVAQFTGAYTPEQAQEAVTKYIDPRMVTEEEVRKAYQEAGLQAPTQADINRFIGQRDQALLTPDIKTYLPTASANVMTEQVSALKAAQDAAAAKQAADQAAAKAAADQAAAKSAADKAAADQAAAKAAADQAAAKQAADQAAAAKAAADKAAAGQADITAKITATDKKLADFAVQTGQSFDSVKAQFKAEFDAAQAAGKSSDAALQAGIDKVGQQAAANKQATDAQLGQLGVDVNAVKAGLGQLGTTTTQQFGDVNARIAQLQQQGLTQAEATNKALLELSSGQAQLGQQVTAGQQATQAQFGDVNARIVELMRQGADYQTATTQAQTELKQGQAQLGSQLGQLGTQVGQLGTTLGGQIAGLGTKLTAAQQQAAQAQQQANMGTLFGLLGGFGGQQAPAPAPAPTPLANIGYVYDIGGKSIFANPQQEKAFVSPYAEGGTVEDLMKILRG